VQLADGAKGRQDLQADDGFAQPQYKDMILEGTSSEELYSIADKIRDAMFTPNTCLML